MKISIKIAVLMIGLVALISSCQKENMPMPGDCPTHEQDQNTGGNMRVGDPQTNDGGGNMGSGSEPTADTIVGHGDDDRDGGGIVGGGDDDKDGGRRMKDESKPR